MGRNGGDDDEDLGIGRLTVEIAAGEQERIAVQGVQHIAMLQADPKLLENQHVLTVVGIEGVTAVRDTAAIGVTVAVHDGAGFAGACLTENVSDGEVPPGVGKLSVPEGGAGAFRLVYEFRCSGDFPDYLQVVRSVF